MVNSNRKTTKWYQYTCAFFSGAFLTDVIVTLVYLGKFNFLSLIIGGFCFWCSKMNLKNKLLLLVFIVGIFIKIVIDVLPK